MFHRNSRPAGMFKIKKLVESVMFTMRLDRESQSLRQNQAIFDNVLFVLGYFHKGKLVRSESFTLINKLFVFDGKTYFLIT